MSLSRRSLLLVPLALATRGRAEHQVFVQVVAQEAFREPGEARAFVDEPVRFGIPLPEAAAAFEPKHLVLVGARTARVTPMVRWPAGAIRWLRVEALVSVSPAQQNGTLYLTQGFAGDAAATISSPAEPRVFAKAKTGTSYDDPIFQPTSPLGLSLLEPGTAWAHRYRARLAELRTLLAAPEGPVELGKEGLLAWVTSGDDAFKDLLLRGGRFPKELLQT